MRLRVPANRKLDGTVRFIAITTGLFFVFYRKRRKFARVETTTSVIGKESYLMTQFSSTRRGTIPPLTEIGRKKKRQTRRHRAFITLIQIVFNRDSPISLTKGLHRNSTRSWSPSKWVSQVAFPCRCNECVPVDLNTIRIACIRNSGVS